MKAFLLAILAAALAAVALSCARRGAEAETALSTRSVIPGISNDTAERPARTFAMGFGITPPEPTTESILEVIPKIAAVAEYTIIQRDVPWTRLQAGESIDAILDADWDELVQYLREVQGLRLVILVDPLDGLDRTRESVEAQKAGVTLIDAETRATHEAFVLEVARRYQPEYLGLASEINTLAAHGDGALYAALRDMINGLLPRIRAVSPDSKLFVSHQVDDAWDLSGRESSVENQFALVHDFDDTDVVGLSSYPGFFWDKPEDIPDDYYQRYADESGKPLIQVEGGWSSERTAWMAPTREATPEAQTRYFQRLFELLDGVEAELVVLLLYSDIDFLAPGWNLTEEQAAGLTNFGSMGIVDAALEPKPAYDAWLGAFRRPLR